MAENIEPLQEAAKVQEVNTTEYVSSKETKPVSEVSPGNTDNGFCENLDSSSAVKYQTSLKPSTDLVMNNFLVEEPHKLSSTEEERIEASDEVQDDDNYEEVEEEYEEECEENGEVKVVIKKRIVQIKKASLEKDQAEEEVDVEEEYEEEELDETGEKTIVIKKRMVKVPKKPSSRRGTIVSFVDQEEEYEEEEVNEEGETVMIKKIRLVKVPKKKGSRKSEKSFDEVEEEYSEEELDENGEKVIVKKIRLVKVLKPAAKKSHDTITEEDTKSLKSFDEKSSKYREDLQEIEDKENVDEEEEEVEEEVAEEEEVLGEGEPPAEEVIKRKKKKKMLKDKVSSEDLLQVEFEKKSRKRRKHRRKSTKDSETSRSDTSIIGSLKEEDEEEVILGEEIEEEEEEGGGEEGAEQSEVSISSSERRLADERAAIAEQFEILQKLRSEHTILKKRNFYLSNRLVKYFKKQKMDHVFTETKGDPEIEHRFVKKLIEFHDSKQEFNEEKLKINSEWEAQLSINEDLSNKVQESWETLTTRKRGIAAKLTNSRTGRTIVNDKTVEDVLARQETQQKQMSECRQLEIKLKRRINAKKQERQMDHMGVDFNLMDYEKLSSLKEYYSDKITERDIEIGEVNEKLASMEDKLRQAKDQLRRRENDLDQEQWRLQNISAELDTKRLDLNKVKEIRHRTEKNTAKMKRQSGLLAYPTLLKDYEEKCQQLEELTAQTDALKRSYKNTVRKMERLRETIRKKTLQKYSYFAMSSTNFAKK